MSADDFVHYDSFSEEDEDEIVDWQLPLCFMKKRHREQIEGSRSLAQTWRMKERVSDPVTEYSFSYLSCFMMPFPNAELSISLCFR